MKILAIKFKQLGDVAIMVPALRALREHWPEAEIHVLVEEAAVPILQHLPWIQKVWGLPRKRGSARLKSTIPLLAQLRKERFDRSVDFVGNDRVQSSAYSSGPRFAWDSTHPRDLKDDASATPNP